MAGSIGIVALQNKLEETLADLICRKHDYLCQGKCVNDINYNLMKMYNWWWLLYQGGVTLTDSEINCVNNEIPNLQALPIVPTTTTISTSTPPIGIDEDDPEEPIVTEFLCRMPTSYGQVYLATNTKRSSLTGAYTTYSGCYRCLNGAQQPYEYRHATALPDGERELKFSVVGGVAPYTFVVEHLPENADWSTGCDTPQPACIFPNTPNVVNPVGTVVPNTEPLEISSGWNYKALITGVSDPLPLKTKITVTDSDGRTTSCTYTWAMYFYNRS